MFNGNIVTKRRNHKQRPIFEAYVHEITDGWKVVKNSPEEPKITTCCLGPAATSWSRALGPCSVEEVIWRAGVPLVMKIGLPVPDFWSTLAGNALIIFVLFPVRCASKGWSLLVNQSSLRHKPFVYVNCNTKYAFTVFLTQNPWKIVFFHTISGWCDNT